MTIHLEIVRLTSKDEGININRNKKEIEIGLNFILSHLEEPTIFPRTVMTKKLGYQRIVYSFIITTKYNGPEKNYVPIGSSALHVVWFYYIIFSFYY